MSSSPPPDPQDASSWASYRPAGVVFDLDGTLVDNLVLHGEALQAFAEARGLPPLTPAFRSSINGQRNSDVFARIFGRPLPEQEWRAFEDEKEARYRELSRGRLTPVVGLTRLLDRLEAERIPFAVATSAPEENVEHTLAEIGLTHRFPIIVRGDQVPRGKPFPDVFQAAARRLEVDAEACLAFEDAPLGVAAALAAGMRCVGIATSDLAPFLLRADPAPDLVVGSFEEFLVRCPLRNS